jgi:molybdopterin biosynthesis enzyme
VSSGYVCKIMTGAPLPPGADAVVMIEDTQIVNSSVPGKAKETIKVLRAVSPGDDIRPKGCDIQVGQVIMRKGDRIGAAEVGLLASVGRLPVVVGVSIALHCIACLCMSLIPSFARCVQCTSVYCTSSGNYVHRG